ncbi:AAA ATPase [Entomortierella beljakovae]|nr:AAA ATPase [Entomortierella beljakovae]
MMSANFLRKRAIVFSDDEDDNADAWPPSPSKRRSGISFNKQFMMEKPIAPPNFGSLLDHSTKSEEKGNEEEEDEEKERVEKKSGLTENNVPKTRSQASKSNKPTIVESGPEAITPPRTPTRRNTRQQAALSESMPDFSSMPTTPKKSTGLSIPRTPTRTPSTRSLDLNSNTPRNINQSTGLTPMVNKMMRSSKENTSSVVAPTTPRKGKKMTKDLQDENAIEKDNAKTPGYSTPKRLQKTKSLGAIDTSAKPCRAVSSEPSTPMSSTLGFYQDAKTLFRRTTEPHRLVGRSMERETIQAFCQEHILVPNAGSLYISGQPGTGKTALLKEIMRDMESEWRKAEHDIKVVNINCMTIKDPKHIYQKLLDEIGYTSESKDKDGTIKALESQFLESNKKKILYAVILDEIDHLLTKDQDVLYKLFQWSSTPGAKLTLFGIANALDMTDRFLPRLKARNCEPQLLNFNPYQVAEIRAIIMDRLFSLEDGDMPAKSLNNKDETGKPRVVPLMQRPAIELCARKVAAATGDLRKALDICRQTIEMVELEAKRKEKLERQLLRGSSPLTEIRLSSLENQAAGGMDRTLLTHRQPINPFIDHSPAGSGTGSTTLQDAPKVTVEHVKKALGSAFGSPVVQKMKSLNVHQKIVLVVLVTKIQSGKTVDCDVGKVFDHFTSTCRSSNKIGAVNRGEFQDLINMLEANGLITLSKAKEERLRKIGLVPRESEVLEAIKGQDILDTIIAKLSLAPEASS